MMAGMWMRRKSEKISQLYCASFRAMSRRWQQKQVTTTTNETTTTIANTSRFFFIAI